MKGFRDGGWEVTRALGLGFPLVVYVHKWDTGGVVERACEFVGVSDWSELTVLQAKRLFALVQPSPSISAC